MIRVTVEIIPGGIGEPRTLGFALIANDGRETHDDTSRGSYDFTFHGKDGRRMPNRTGYITGFPRKRLTAWHLLARCLEEADFLS